MLSRLGALGVCRAGPEDSSLALLLLQLAFCAAAAAAAAAAATIAAIGAAIASLLRHCSMSRTAARGPGHFCCFAQTLTPPEASQLLQRHLPALVTHTVHMCCQVVATHLSTSPVVC